LESRPLPNPELGVGITYGELELINPRKMEGSDMRIWFDILSPKQLFLFTSMARRLRDLGHEVWMTSRRYVQLEGLIDGVFRDWRIVEVGEWGGGGLEGKLRASIARMGALLEEVLSERPDACFSSGSPEASRICYGLGIPHYMVSDSPHSPVNRLSAPISERIFTPWIIPRREWISMGARMESITPYRALDPCFWLRDFKPDRIVLDELGLEEGGYILFRMPETQASYLRAGDEPFLRMADELAGISDMPVVVSCRYPEQVEAAKSIIKAANAIIVDKLLPGPSVIHYSALFIGGGGTMTQEAALLGVPTISIYPGRLPTVLDFLRRRGLIHHIEDLGRLSDAVREMLGRIDYVREEWRRRSRRIWRMMEDPLSVIIGELRSSANPSQRL